MTADIEDGRFDGVYEPWDGNFAEAWDGLGGWSVEAYGADVMDVTGAAAQLGS